MGASLSTEITDALRNRHAEFRRRMDLLLGEDGFLIVPCAPISTLVAGADHSAARPTILRYTTPIILAGTGVKEAIAAVGATVRYLPPYSPDLNPIENLFSKLKALLRKAAKRSLDDVWMEIGELLNTVSSSECANYFASSGYVLLKLVRFKPGTTTLCGKSCV